MKIKIIDGKEQIVCEVCEKEIKLGTPLRNIGQYRAHNYYKNDRGQHIITLDLADEEQFLASMQYFHEDCYNKPITNDADSMKEQANRLSKETRQKLYVYLHEALGCRI